MQVVASFRILIIYFISTIKYRKHLRNKSTITSALRLLSSLTTNNRQMRW